MYVVLHAYCMCKETQTIVAQIVSYLPVKREKLMSLAYVLNIKVIIFTQP